MSNIKVTFWVLPVSLGDGSASVRIFRDREAAEKYEENLSEPWSESCIKKVVLEVNAKTGEIVSC